MKQQDRGGSIVNISSVGGLYGAKNASVYCASKGAVANLTRALAIEQGPYDIRVNAINPGTTQTAMTINDLETAGEKGDRIPLQRDAEPIDIANAALYLASDEAAFVNGHNLVVDGGASIKHY
jgi:NAD(P)-dependent dehydrogenase (short-subunit alcohol dehydrogenase family)